MTIAKLHRSEAGELPALAGEVCLVGISGADCGPRQILVRGRGEASETKHPLNGLRAVADGGQKAATQLTFTETQLVGELVNALARIDEADHGGLNRLIGRVLGEQAARGGGEQHGDMAKLRVRTELFARIQAKLTQADAAVTELLEWPLERRSTRSGKESSADHQLARTRVGEPGPGIGAGDNGAVPGTPDDVNTGIGHDSHGVAVTAPQPQTRDRAAQARRCSKLAVGVRFVQDAINTVGFNERTNQEGFENESGLHVGRRCDRR